MTHKLSWKILLHPEVSHLHISVRDTHIPRLRILACLS